MKNSNPQFNLRSYFSIFSITIICFLTIILSGLAYWNQRSTLLNYSMSSAHIYADQLRERILGEFIKTKLSGYGELSIEKDSPELEKIDHIADHYLYDYNEIVKFKIYDLKGKTIYSTEPEEIGVVNESETFANALHGEMTYELKRRTKAINEDRSERKADNIIELLEVYVQIKKPSLANEEGKVIGILEVYKDVTPLFALMRREFYKVPLMLIFSMSALYMFLQMIINNANSIIKEQHKEIEMHNEELEEAQSMFKEAMDEVIEHSSFHVRFQGEGLLRCWEVKKCNQKECPSYESEDFRCWQVSGTYCGGEVQGVFAKKYGDCRQCEVYKHAFKDRINMIGESFNNMMTLLHNKHVELEEANSQLNILIDIDPLTQISNRRSFQKRIENIHLMSLRYNHPYSIVICDIDNFKLYNDTYGHQQGDYVLISVANSMKSSIRRTDEIFRWGGEEFIVILPEQSHTKALKVAENLRRSVYELQIKHKSSDLNAVTVSCGVASFFPWKTKDVGWNSVVKQADDALYKAKIGQKNCVYSASIV